MRCSTICVVVRMQVTIAATEDFQNTTLALFSLEMMYLHGHNIVVLFKTLLVFKVSYAPYCVLTMLAFELHCHLAEAAGKSIAGSTS